MPQFNIYTEEWPPYQILNEGVLTGVSVELLEKLLMKTGSSQTRKDFDVVPWARGYNFLEGRPGTILFLTTRTRERDKLFKWVGPVFKNKTFLFAKKSRGIKIGKVSDLASYRFGVIIDDAGERYLRELGVPSRALSSNSASSNNLKMLNIGRVDMVVDNWENLKADAVLIGSPLSDYEAVYLLDAADVSYALHIDTPESVINELQRAFDQLSESGIVDDIFRQYGISRQ